VKQATAALEGKGFSEKNELLLACGINFNDVPLWQKHGVGLYWDAIEKEGFNPVTGEKTKSMRRQIRVDRSLPRGEDFAKLVSRVMTMSAV